MLDMVTIGAFFSKNKLLPIALAASLLVLTFLRAEKTMVELQSNTPPKVSHTAPPHAQTPILPPNLAEFHFFGHYQENLALLPITTLQLSLEGILLALNPAGTSRAIIRSRDTSKIYRPGQKLPGGATLQAIEQTQVILEQDHQLTRLQLPIPQLKKSTIR